jgi:hypothetical protein
MMAKRLMFVLGSVALLAVFSLAADQPPQSGGGMMGGMGMRGMMGGGGGMMRGMGGMMGGNFDFSKPVRLDGNVESVVMAQGQGFPRFVLALADGTTRVTVVTAPFCAVLDAKYKIAIGDQMSVVAFQSAQYKEVFVAAELKNLSNNAVLTLRDASGAPVANPAQGNGRGCAGRGNGNCARNANYPNR